MKEKFLNAQKKLSISNQRNKISDSQEGEKRPSKSNFEKTLLTQIIKKNDPQFKKLKLDLNLHSKEISPNQYTDLNIKLMIPQKFQTTTGDRLINTSDVKNTHKTREKYQFSDEIQTETLPRKQSITGSNDFLKFANYSRKASSKFSSNPFSTISEKIISISNIKNKIVEDYTKLSFKPTADGKREIINQWKKVLELTLNIDPKLFINSLKCLGDIYLEFDNYELAKHFYYNYKFFSFYLELLDDLIIAYESLGNVYKFLFQYHKAIKCYKKQIEIAWVINNKYAELRGYDNIGIQYFYLGDKEKAKYYHERMVYGRVESLNSDTRELVVKNYRNKNFYLFNDDKYIKSNKTIDELKRKLKDALLLFEDDHDVNLENFDIFKNQENMKNSFISDVEMSFTIIPEKYLKDEFDINCLTLPPIKRFKKGIKVLKRGRSLNYMKSNQSSKPAFHELDIKHENHNVNNIILSHLSTKRKDFNTDRFRKLFERFDKILCEIKKNILSSA